MLPVGVFSDMNKVISASGGNSIVTFNGYKHHIFTASGTFSVSTGSDECYVLVQNGGATGLSSSRTDTVIVRSGQGGSSGSASLQIISANPGSSFAVTVGGANSSSSIASGTTILTYNTRSGAGPLQIQGYGGYSFIVSNLGLSSGDNGQDLNSASVFHNIYASAVSGVYRSSLGGGGGAGAVYGYDVYTGASNGSSPLIPGIFGGGYGGSYTTQNTANVGFNATSNTGGGGGGGGARLDTAGGNYYGSRTASGGSGGSGYVIVSYKI